MTGEMYHIDQNGFDGESTWDLHAAIAEAVGGELRPFDQYQGPYIVVGPDLTAGQGPYTVPIQNIGIVRLWIVNADEISLQVYREDTEELSFGFLWDDTETAIQAAKSLL